MTDVFLDKAAAVEKVLSSRWRVTFFDGPCVSYVSDQRHESAVAALTAAFDQLAAAHPELGPRVNSMRVVCEPVHREDEEISGVPS